MAIVGLILVMAMVGYISRIKLYEQMQTGDVVVIRGRVWDEGMRLRFGRLEIQVPAELKVEFLDRIELAGKVEPRLTGDDNNKIRLKYQSIYKIEKASGLIRHIGQIRHMVWELWQLWLPGDRGKLMAGIMVGGNGLSKSAQLVMRQIGLAHIVAASGFNLVIVVQASMWVLARVVGRRWGRYMVLITIAAYVGLAGLNPAIIRAGIMAVVATAGLFTGRKSSGKYSLILCVAVMWLGDAEIVESISWQLSVAATAGLVWLGPELGGKSVGVVEELKTTMAAIIMTLPIVWHQFGQVSWIAPVANLLVAPVVPLLMQFGLVVTLGGLIWSPIGQAGAYLAWPALTWTLEVSAKLASVFGGQWQLAKLNWMGVIGCYLLIGASIWLKRK